MIFVLRMKVSLKFPAIASSAIREDGVHYGHGRQGTAMSGHLNDRAPSLSPGKPWSRDGSRGSPLTPKHILSGAMSGEAEWMMVFTCDDSICEYPPEQTREAPDNGQSSG
jgi:hypothetical protein